MKIYPDSAHGFLFQHHTEFAADVGTFLGTPGERARSPEHQARVRVDFGDVVA